MSGAEYDDRQAIHEVVLRYCRGIDRLDMDLVRSTYHPDGIDHHTGFDGGIDDFLTWVEPGLRRLGGTMHLLANHLVDLDGDQAVAETYGQAVHWSEHRQGNFTTGFRYVDHLTRRDGRWAVSERWAVREWTHSETPGSLGTAVGPVGRRDRDDPLYLALARLR
ncbi:nuclear transport factor 2 family protein [Jatrophihabitans sp.]|uniref:nuclear transport factor 2 family protein n=1 Tax=Jatrophihabitans sp. TaxID=1932789 RepID=UPI0030C6A6B9|nr:hypothetical protein [Jatrophihabitans sp.]